MGRKPKTTMADALQSRLAAKPGDVKPPSSDPIDDGSDFIPRASKQKGRGVLIRTNLAGWRQMKLLAFEQNRTLGDIGVEALQDLLRKYGKPVVLDKPED